MRFALLFCASALTLLADTSQLGYLGRTYTVVEMNDLFVTYRVTDQGTNTANYEPIYAARGGGPKDEFVDLYRHPFLHIEDPNYPVMPGPAVPEPCGPCGPPPVAPVPEPGTLVLLVASAIFALAIRAMYGEL